MVHMSMRRENKEKQDSLVRGRRGRKGGRKGRREGKEGRREGGREGGGNVLTCIIIFFSFS